MPKTEKKPLWDYPKYDQIEVGCRVSWYYYKSLNDAKKAASIADEHGDWCAARGFDFGYCCPGSLTRITEGKYKGMYEVCIP